ncbi:hypothetical protein [Paraclostridium sp. AKS81]|uniref:hypothetical protein n=1 Tax=Paraclostridium sp. AKS81 TaxID=2876117 RepID=UPI0021E01E83|nr:hypothetical protein [Paraclostridium sp. AKS81]MCU9811890.1 hypothetical protein [Paraclostridium sp. AKS81]
MRKIAEPFEDELPGFEKNLGIEIDRMINNILQFNVRKKRLNMEDKTWTGLCLRLENAISNKWGIAKNKN